MKAGTLAIQLIKQFEGCKLKSYQDSAGIWTIGFGSIMYADGSRVKRGDAITQFQADAMLSWQIDLKAIGVDSLLHPWTISQARFDVLCSLVYNIGLGAFRSSTLLKKIKANVEDPSIPAEFLKWNKASVAGKLVEIPGLTKRRTKEAGMWFEPIE